MTMMQERPLQTVELPLMPELDTAELAMSPIAPAAPENVVATTANGTEVHLNEPVARYARPETAVEEPQIKPETVRAVGSLTVDSGERSASLVNYQDKNTLTPQQRLDAARARWSGNGQEDMTRFTQERRTRRVQSGVDTYNVVTALTGGYLPGFRR